MRIKPFLALAVVSVSGALCSASCVLTGEATTETNTTGATKDPGLNFTPSEPIEQAGDSSLNFTPSEPIAQTQDPIVGLAAIILRATCSLAIGYAATRACDDDKWWEDHCPQGSSHIVNDVWTKKFVVISCDRVKEITCYLNGAANERILGKLLCSLPF